MSTSPESRHAELEDIRRRAAEATPGPWQWYGNTESDLVFLATTYGGRIFVLMPEARLETTYYDTNTESEISSETYRRMVFDEQEEVVTNCRAVAGLRFQDDGVTTDSKRHARYEALGGMTREEAGLDVHADRSNSPLYREDFVGLDHPDAEFIANARRDVDFLLSVIADLEDLVYYLETDR